ncbi:hypothetical protein [Oscillatoria salina]|uniref:hypothetical protein n=1 Tax=Oscillatoria salina TaxID=331517 RepID=UPI0013BE4402|nr:hypothetical protein [Oscillatoria salina]MBZ8182351.1 hypothetical protein [Oscillatoria salina IIICB1]NET87924.1 hypothetical protein [Kamptonema sp. SIO1D9]
MKTLLTLFSQERSELKLQIEQTTSPEQVVQLVQNRLDNLEKNYIGELNIAQVRLAGFFLDALRQSVATLAAAKEKKRELESNQKRQYSPKKIALKVVQGLICLGILDSLLSRTAAAAWMGVLLVSLLVGLEVLFQFDRNNQNDASTKLLEPSPVQIDSQLVLDNLADALQTIDLAVTRVENTQQHLDSNGIEQLPELLNLLQRLVGASLLEKPQMALQLTKLIPQVLIEQGISVQMYQQNSDRLFFDFEPSIDPTTQDYITIAPALLKGDRLLRRGRVIEPAYSQAKE